MENQDQLVVGAPVLMGTGTLFGYIMGTLFLLPNAYVTHPQRVVELELAVPAYVQENADLVDNLANGYALAYQVNLAKAHDYARWIVDSANYHQLDPFLLSALVMTESTFRNEARSSVGAIGPAQVRPLIWDEVCLVDLENPEDNIWCAGMILSRYRDWCDGNMDCALQTYNVGPRHMRTASMAPARARYLGKINRYHEGLRLAMR